MMQTPFMAGNCPRQAANESVIPTCRETGSQCEIRKVGPASCRSILSDRQDAGPTPEGIGNQITALARSYMVLRPAVPIILGWTRNLTLFLFTVIT